MALIVGIYNHTRSENLDEYFKAVGVPLLGRKLMVMSNPRLEIENDEGKWTIRNVTMMHTSAMTFNLGDEYEESMPNGERLKNVTTVDGNSLVTRSTGPKGSKLLRRYDFSPEGCIVTTTHEESGQVAKRFYNRVVAT